MKDTYILLSATFTLLILYTFMYNPKQEQYCGMCAGK